MKNQTEPKGHPKGLYLLFVTEMWERFSYYGMRALFMLYMTQALLFNKEYSSEIYGSYTGLVYLTPLLGGYISDRYCTTYILDRVLDIEKVVEIIVDGISYQVD